VGFQGIGGGETAVPRPQIIQPIDIGGEQGRQGHEGKAAVHLKDPEDELGGHHAKKQAQAKAEESLHVFILPSSPWIGKTTFVWHKSTSHQGKAVIPASVRFGPAVTFLN
jgi:hypothetical protein